MSTPTKDFSTLTDPTSPAARTRLAKMIMSLFDHWDVDTSAQALLLGLSPEDRWTLTGYRNGSPFENSSELIGRAGHLLSIHKSLRIIFPQDLDLAYRWVSAPNRRFNEKKPLEIMTESYKGLLAIRAYLESESRDEYSYDADHHPEVAKDLQ